MRFPTECQKYSTRCGAAQGIANRTRHRLCLAGAVPEARDNRRIVFQIGILYQDEVASGFLNATAQCGSLAHIPRLNKYPNSLILCLHLSQNLGRSVTRTVIDTNQFKVEGHRKDAFHNFTHGIALVVHRHDDGQFHIDKVTPV